jgi:hypothetical protein
VTKPKSGLSHAINIPGAIAKTEAYLGILRTIVNNAVFRSKYDSKLRVLWYRTRAVYHENGKPGEMSLTGLKIGTSATQST